MRIYDPTAGSGGMLIQVRDYLREHGGDASRVALYGQEKVGTTWSICKMNTSFGCTTWQCSRRCLTKRTLCCGSSTFLWSKVMPAQHK